jgi:hypothetical protein
MVTELPYMDSSSFKHPVDDSDYLQDFGTSPTCWADHRRLREVAGRIGCRTGRSGFAGLACMLQLKLLYTAKPSALEAS